MFTVRQPMSPQKVSNRIGSQPGSQSGPKFPDESYIQISPQITVGDVTMYTGRLMTPVSLYEKSALACVFHPDTVKEVVSGKVGEDGVYSFVCGATDYFSSNHLLAFMPQKVMVNCVLNEEQHIQRAVITELVVEADNIFKLGKIYSDVFFDSPGLSDRSSSPGNSGKDTVEESESHSQPATKEDYSIRRKATHTEISNHLRYNIGTIRHRDSIAAALSANGLSATRKRIQEVINSERCKSDNIYKSAKITATDDEIKEQVRTRDKDGNKRTKWQIYDDLHEMGRAVDMKRIMHFLFVETAAQQSHSQAVNQGADIHSISADEPDIQIFPRITVGDVTISGDSASNPEKNAVEEPESHSQPATNESYPVVFRRATDTDISNHLRYNKSRIIRHRDSIAASLRAKHLSVTAKRIQEVINRERGQSDSTDKPIIISATSDEIKEQISTKDKNGNKKTKWQIFDDLHEMGRSVEMKRIIHFLAEESMAQQQVPVPKKRCSKNASDKDILDLAFDNDGIPRTEDKVLEMLHSSDKAAGKRRLIKILKEAWGKTSLSGEPAGMSDPAAVISRAAFGR